MADTQRILHHIAELYAKPRVNQDLDSAILEMEEKMSARFEDYNAAFADKLTADVIKAVDDYWRFKSDKTRPTLAQLLAMENADTTKKDRKDTDPESHDGMRARILKCADELGDKWGREARDKYLKLARQQWPDVNLSGHDWTEPEIPAAEKNAAGGYAEAYMRRDIKLNRCRHLLPVYQATVRYIAEDFLLREIPAEQWRRLTFAQRCELAMKKGLFNDFDNLLTAVCRRDWGKDVQFDAESQTRPFSVSRAINRLGAHFSAQDDSNDNFDMGDVI